MLSTGVKLPKALSALVNLFDIFYAVIFVGLMAVLNYGEDTSLKEHSLVDWF